LATSIRERGAFANRRIPFLGLRLSMPAPCPFNTQCVKSDAPLRNHRSVFRAGRLALEQSNATARRLLGASIAYLPLLLIALLFDRS
jgi:hypothetical protein